MFNNWRNYILIRKSAKYVTACPRFLLNFISAESEYKKHPSIIVNSFPKSGTHLLIQIARVFPETRDWGNFIASLGSSFFYCPLPLVKLNRKIKALAPAELCGAHIFHTPEIKRIFEEINSVHFFIYRDPRDVAISEAHYLTHMNHWHRLSKYFRQLPSMEHQIKFSITGATGAHFPCYYPNIAQRFAHYNGWLKDPNTFSLRYEDLISDCKERIIRAIIEFYANKAESDIDIDTHVAIALKNINPAASHTYRQGKAGGWKKAFTDEHKRIFKRLAGDLLIELGYEKNKDW